jgi:hypothetical protein
MTYNSFKTFSHLFGRTKILPRIKQANRLFSQNLFKRFFRRIRWLWLLALFSFNLNFETFSFKLSLDNDSTNTDFVIQRYSSFKFDMTKRVENDTTISCVFNVNG